MKGALAAATGAAGGASAFVGGWWLGGEWPGGGGLGWTPESDPSKMRPSECPLSEGSEVV